MLPLINFNIINDIRSYCIEYSAQFESFEGFTDPQHDEDVRKAFEDFMAKYKKFPGVDHLFMSHMFFELV